MSLANLNTADFIKGDNVSQDGRVITVGPVSSDRSGFTSYAYAIWSGSGLTFNVFTSSCYINGVLYPALNDSVTLDAADPTDPRLDLIIRTATTIDYITGTPATDPVKPTADNLTELEVTVVLIQAGATTPDVTEEVIYAENAEWTGSSDTTSPDFANTNDPVSGTYHVNINGFTNGQYVQFVDASTHDFTDYNYLKFYVRLKDTFGATAGFIIYFKNGSYTVTTSFTVTNGIYSFDRTDLSGYQLIAIPLNEFTITGGSTFDTVVFSLKGSNTSGFKMDNIGLQGGVVGASDLQNAITTIITDSGTVISDQPSDTIQILGGTNCTTSAAGKVITIDATGGGGTPGGADTYVQYNDSSAFNGDSTFTFNETTKLVTTQKVKVAGTAGEGYYELVGQSATPSAPSAGSLRIFAQTVQGFTRLVQDNEATSLLVYGRDNSFIARNSSGSTITKGSVVYATGSTGNVPIIALAQANADATSQIVGVVVDDIANNAFGQVMVMGIIANFDTSAFSSGNKLYLSTSSAGGLTATRPSGGSDYIAPVGVVLVSGVGNGSILVNISTYDNLASSGGSVSDTAYGVGWNGDTTNAPSKNAVYDKVETLAPLASPTFTGTPAAPTASNGTNTTQLATTAFVRQELNNSATLSNVGAKLYLFNAY